MMLSNFATASKKLKQFHIENQKKCVFLQIIL